MHIPLSGILLRKASVITHKLGASGIEGDRVADVGCSESCQEGMINEQQLQLRLTFGEPSRTSAELSELDKDRAEQPIIPPSLRWAVSLIPGIHLGKDREISPLHSSTLLWP